VVSPLLSVLDSSFCRTTLHLLFDTHFSAARSFLHGVQLKAKDLELQLAEAKLQQALAVHAEAMSSHADRDAQRAQHEAQLQQQLALYGTKFEEFQAAMAKSSEVRCAPLMQGFRIPTPRVFDSGSRV
jgi:Myosin-like coiled-coil protein